MIKRKQAATRPHPLPRSSNNDGLHGSWTNNNRIYVLIYVTERIQKRRSSMCHFARHLTVCIRGRRRQPVSLTKKSPIQNYRILVVSKLLPKFVLPLRKHCICSWKRSSLVRSTHISLFSLDPICLLVPCAISYALRVIGQALINVRVIIGTYCSAPGPGGKFAPIGGTESSRYSSYRLAGNCTVHHTSNLDNSASKGSQEKNSANEKERSRLEHHRWWVGGSCFLLFPS
jgi:hypothetical protein